MTRKLLCKMSWQNIHGLLVIDGNECLMGSIHCTGWTGNSFNCATSLHYHLCYDRELTTNTQWVIPFCNDSEFSEEGQVNWYSCCVLKTVCNNSFLSEFEFPVVAVPFSCGVQKHYWIKKNELHSFKAVPIC